LLNGLDLFSGIGGITLALQDWVRPVAYCEQDRYCQAVLLSKMQDGALPNAGVWDDVRTLDAEELPSRIDIIYGGFPCQDISSAGYGVGLGGERSGLFFHIARLVKETNPRFVFLENVPAIRTRGLNSVVQTFTELGYDCRWTVVSAAEVGAPHLRKRWFMLAHSASARLERPRVDGNVNSPIQQKRKPSAYASSCGKIWGQSFEQSLRVDDGLPNWVDRIKGLGNAVVPLQAKTAFERLLGLESLILET